MQNLLEDEGREQENGPASSIGQSATRNRASLKLGRKLRASTTERPIKLAMQLGDRQVRESLIAHLQQPEAAFDVVQLFSKHCLLQAARCSLVQHR